MSIIIISAIFLGILLYQVLRLVFSPAADQPMLYLQVNKDAQNIEWLLRQFCSALKGRPLTVIDEAEGETSLILAKLSWYYGYELARQRPLGAEDVLTVEKGVGIRELKRQLKLVEQKEKERKIKSAL